MFDDIVQDITAADLIIDNRYYPVLSAKLSYSINAYPTITLEVAPEDMHTINEAKRDFAGIAESQFNDDFDTLLDRQYNTLQFNISVTSKQEEFNKLFYGNNWVPIKVIPSDLRYGIPYRYTVVLAHPVSDADKYLLPMFDNSMLTDLKLSKLKDEKNIFRLYYRYYETIIDALLEKKDSSAADFIKDTNLQEDVKRLYKNIIKNTRKALNILEENVNIDGVKNLGANIESHLQGFGIENVNVNNFDKRILRGASGWLDTCFFINGSPLKSLIQYIDSFFCVLGFSGDIDDKLDIYPWPLMSGIEAKTHIKNYMPVYDLSDISNISMSPEVDNPEFGAILLTADVVNINWGETRDYNIGATGHKSKQGFVGAYIVSDKGIAKTVQAPLWAMKGFAAYNTPKVINRQRYAFFVKTTTKSGLIVNKDFAGLCNLIARAFYYKYISGFRQGAVAVPITNQTYTVPSIVVLGNTIGLVNNCTYVMDISSKQKYCNLSFFVLN